MPRGGLQLPGAGGRDTLACMDDVVRRLHAARAAFARHPAVAVAYVFGSRARGEARPESDLDVGLVYRRGERARR